MIHVRLQNRILDNKTSVVMFLPLFIWVAVLLGTFFTMLATSWYRLVPVLGVEFLCIIPVFLLCKSRVGKAFATLDGKFYEADIEVRDRKLYYNNKELKLHCDKRTGTISLRHEMIAGKYQTRAFDFWAIVCDEDREMFLEVCNFYHVKVPKRKIREANQKNASKKSV